MVFMSSGQMTWLGRRPKRSVFVLDLADESALAFEAESAVAAEWLTQETWFTRSLADFRRSRPARQIELASGRIRMATEAEAALYQDRATEFAELSDDVLVAHIPKL